MLGHAIMALLLGVHDKEHKELDSENAPQRYLDLVDSPEYNVKPLYCPSCDNHRVRRRGKESRRYPKPHYRWQCGKCGRNWFTEV